MTISKNGMITSMAPGEWYKYVEFDSNGPYFFIDSIRYEQKYSISSYRIKVVLSNRPEVVETDIWTPSTAYQLITDPEELAMLALRLL